MDLFHIKKRIKSKAEFQVTYLNTFAPKLSMRVYGMEISAALRISEAQDIMAQTGIGFQEHIKDILINEFIANKPNLTKFIQLENRERNLNQLLNEDMGLYN